MRIQVDEESKPNKWVAQTTFRNETVAIKHYKDYDPLKSPGIKTTHRNGLYF